MTPEIDPREKDIRAHAVSWRGASPSLLITTLQQTEYLLLLVGELRERQQQKELVRCLSDLLFEDSNKSDAARIATRLRAQLVLQAIVGEDTSCPPREAGA